MEQEEMKACINGLSARLDSVETMIRDIHRAIVGDMMSGELGLSAKVHFLWTEREIRSGRWWGLVSAVALLVVDRFWQFLKG